MPTLREYNGGKIDNPHVFTNVLGDKVVLLPNPGGEGETYPMYFIRDLDTLVNYLKQGGRLWGILGYLSAININDSKAVIQRQLGGGFVLPEDCRVLGDGQGFLLIHGTEYKKFSFVNEVMTHFGLERCCECQAWNPVSCLTNGDHGYHCAPCQARFTPCALCSEEIPPREFGRVSGVTGHVCPECCNSYHYCGDCEEHHNTRFCPNADLDEIHDHGFHPEIQPKGEISTSRFPFYLGMELELCTEYPVETLKYIRRHHKDLFWGVYDGSVSGVEIVSQPATYEYWKDLTFHIHSSVRSGGGGIHLHVDRAGFKHDQVLNVLKFFWGNKDFVKAIAERDEKLEEWAQIRDPERDYRGVSDLRTWKGGDKYSAVNFCHSKTLEFRIFNTAKAKPTILKNMEFISSLWDWTNSGSLASTPKKRDYLSFVKEKDYPNLNGFIATENLTA